MDRALLRPLVLLLGGGLAVPAAAGPYLGAAGLYAKYRQDSVDAATGHQLFAGYRFDDTPLMLEAAWYDLGEADYKQAAGEQLAFDGYQLSIGYFDRFDRRSDSGFWARVGYYVGESERRDASGAPLQTGDSHGFTLGFGADWMPLPYAGVRLAFEDLFQVRDFASDSNAVAISLGVVLEWPTHRRMRAPAIVAPAGAQPPLPVTRPPASAAPAAAAMPAPAAEPSFFELPGERREAAAAGKAPPPAASPAAEVRPERPQAQPPTVPTPAPEPAPEPAPAPTPEPAPAAGLQSGPEPEPAREPARGGESAPQAAARPATSPQPAARTTETAPEVPPAAAAPRPAVPAPAAPAALSGAMPRLPTQEGSPARLRSQTLLRRQGRPDAPAEGALAAGTRIYVRSCQGGPYGHWCYIAVDGTTGWVEGAAVER